MPTSVLLAVLTAAGLFALAPALVRRYDATERLVAERAVSTARILSRRRRLRTVPGRRPVHPPSRLGLSVPPAAAEPLRLVEPGERARLRRARQNPVVYRRRRVLAALLLLNLVELAGVLLVGPGFWIGVTVTGSMLLFYLGHLRSQALRQARHRRAEARQALWLTQQQAEVRLAQQRRAFARREAARLLQEELQRAASEQLAPPTITYRKTKGVRGRAYDVGPAA